MAAKTYAYVRVSSKEQNEDRQVLAMLAVGIAPQNIFTDKQSGKDFDRPSYQKMLRRLRPGDLLIIKSIDRLGRNYKEIMEQWRIITNEREADIRVLDMPLLDTTKCKDLLGTFISDVVLQLLSFVAENERQNIRQRQSEGIAAAKLRGVRFGRPQKPMQGPFEEIFARWKRKEIPLCEATAQLGISESTFYRRMKRDLEKAGRAV